ncbi:hypothetical protein HI113_26080 [Corallococcus exiguus]|uniref:hypothetical protein n=1 Tax=Corallococcus TaxID=83461 RepID=UPI000EB9A627|nr:MULTISPECIES: hypothetical protein [Corallococcus]NNB97373.1 hypothetical protein [Corallococcus exiguus]NPC49832.1 hypothetical protein [Corallococcus exiguus]RKH85988.1 hypothetical protein D7X99_04330 [Corallococcus sp. AB032C]
MQRLKWFVGAIALLALACGEVSETSTPVIREGEGLLELPLVSTSAGRSYKLVGATFAITGPQNATIADTSAESVSLALMAGKYTIQMNGDWHVERTDVPGITVPVTLVSPNPLTFTLGEGETRPVRFLFKVPGDGTADVGIGVDSGGWVSGTLVFEPRSPPPPGSPADIFVDMGGKSVPFVISYESSTVTRSIEYGYKRIQVQSGPVTVQFGGETTAAVQQQFVAALKGATLSFFMEASGPNSVYMGTLFLENQAHSVLFYLDLPPSILKQDAEGYPLLETVAFAVGYSQLSTLGLGSAYAEIHDGTFAPR